MITIAFAAGIIVGSQAVIIVAVLLVRRQDARRWADAR